MNRKYRKTVIAGNWKMNKTPSETKEFMTQLKAILPLRAAGATWLCAFPPCAFPPLSAPCVRPGGHRRRELQRQSLRRLHR